jgi:hypothetical protein
MGGKVAKIDAFQAHKVTGTGKDGESAVYRSKLAEDKLCTSFWDDCTTLWDTFRYNYFVYFLQYFVSIWSSPRDISLTLLQPRRAVISKEPLFRCTRGQG